MINQLKTGLCVAAIACLAGALPAAASNLQTINTSNAYVDLSIAAAFVTAPTLCTEAIGSQSASAAGCNDLGTAAVEAINGSGLSPDQYWEARFPDPSRPATIGTGNLHSKNSFVPNNDSAQLGESGYLPVFSQHKYNLFGRGDEKMGPLSREDILFVFKANGSAQPVAQTQPGSDEIWNAMDLLLARPATDTTLTLAGADFTIANLGFYTELTGITTGGAGIVNSYCTVGEAESIVALLAAFSVFVTTSDPLVQAQASANCASKSGTVKRVIWLDGNARGYTPNLCGGGVDPFLSAPNCLAREQWVDQTVVSYMESFADPNSPINSLMDQNFRSQFSFDTGQQLSLARTLTDFRMEQDVTLGGNAFEAARQTFQQAMSAVSTPVKEFLRPTLGQLVTQDAQGWFSSCLNCDSTANNVSHAFTPRDFGLTFMPYTNVWRDLPSISHGASSGNLTSFATEPGAPGP